VDAPDAPVVPARGWLRRRLLDPVLGLLQQGLAPSQLALSLAFGLGVGIFPVMGVSTPLLTVIALGLRLNLPTIQLVNYLAAPLQLAMIIPFVRLGERVLGAEPQPLTVAAGIDLVAQGALRAIVLLWDAIVHAALGWIVIGPVLIFVLYRLLLPLLERAAARMGRRAARDATHTR
jgi:uncharacterized protein (DUF2062 family)